MTTQTSGKQSGNLLTVSEVASLLHVHPNTVRRWAAQGVLTAWRLGPRGDRRFERLQVLQLLEPPSSDAPQLVNGMSGGDVT